MSGRQFQTGKLTSLKAERYTKQTHTIGRAEVAEALGWWIERLDPACKLRGLQSTLSLASNQI